MDIKKITHNKKTVSNLQDGILQSRPLTEEEKMLEVDKFFAQEEARRINWRRTHRKKMEQQGGDVS